MNIVTWTRRDLMKLAATLGLTPTLGVADSTEMLRRQIPVSGEALPVIGLGTYIVFDVASDHESIASRRALVDLMIEKGASVLDSSPMYNRAEQVVGDIIDDGADRKNLFLATKVWTNGKASGERQMKESFDLMRADVMDLMQVHNLRDTEVHLATIRDRQAEGKIRYSGVTHYTAGALRELEVAMKNHKPQFIQINYSLGERDADQRILPLAADLGIAVIINRPFVAGRLFRAVGNRDLPDWAGEFADSWGQLFLKYIVSHPAVTCVIPATSKLLHMADNLGAGFGPMPDDSTRIRIADYFDAL